MKQRKRIDTAEYVHDVVQDVKDRNGNKTGEQRWHGFCAAHRLKVSALGKEFGYG